MSEVGYGAAIEDVQVSSTERTDFVMFETFVGDKVTKRVNVWTCLKYFEGYDAKWSGWLFDSGDRPQNYEMIQVVEIFPKCVGRRLEDEIAAPETSNGFNPSAPNRLGSMFCEMQFTHASSYIDIHQ